MRIGKWAAGRKDTACFVYSAKKATAEGRELTTYGGYAILIKEFYRLFQKALGEIPLFVKIYAP